MSDEQRYPSPNTAQVNAGATPFFNQKPDSSIPDNLSLLQSASDSNRDQGQPSNHHDHHHESHEYNTHQDMHSGAMHQPPQAHMHHPTHNLADDAFRAAQAQQHSETLAQHVMNLNNPHIGNHSQDPNLNDGSGGGGDASNDAAIRGKRAKVSRACDECRRKKIRCDALETDPNSMCSNCRRTGAVCRFSRTPMKRGPSKGYIKELADKITTLESRLGPPFGTPGGPVGMQEAGYNAYGQVFEGQPQHQQGLSQDGQMEQGRMDYGGTPTTQAMQGRKRTHSMSEGGRAGSSGGANGMLWDQRYTPAQPSNNAWSPAESGQRNLPPLGQPQTPTQESARVRFSPRSGEWRYGDQDSGRRDGVTYAVERDAVTDMPFEWDEAVVDEYYRIYHQTFPLLPHSKQRLRNRLANCPLTLREAFLVALDCCIRSSPHSSLLSGPTADLRAATKRAAELVSASQYENMATRTLSTHLVYIHTLILMALESDNHGPATMRGLVGPPRAEWLGRAIGMATHLKLNSIGMNSDGRFDQGDLDSDEKLGRRAWWILFILDRWHAISTSCLLQLPDNSSSLGVEDQSLLGEGTWHLARLSFILGHLTAIIQDQQTSLAASHNNSSTTPWPGPTSTAPIISTLIHGEIDRFRESVESLLLGSPNLIHLCYWHVRLLIYRLTTTTTLHELLLPAARMAGILNSKHTTITPLNHHFAALAALTLKELREVGDSDIRERATDALGEIERAIGEGKGIIASVGSEGWDSAVRELVVGINAGEDRDGASGEGEGDRGTTAAATLQGLADAAVGGFTAGNGNGAAAGAGGIKTKDGAAAASKGSPHAQDAFDPTALTRYGYLAALVREEP